MEKTTIITLIDGRYFEFEGHMYDVTMMNICEGGLLRYCSLRGKMIDENTVKIWVAQ